MGKRPKVPAALHSELSEYSSLLRALRTSDTLDLASQLTSSLPPTAPASTYEDDVATDASLDDEGESERPLTETATDSQGRAGGSQHPDDPAAHDLKRKAKRKAKTTKAPKDRWTRWPLLAGDVYVPEWSLEDEVRSIATQALDAQLQNDASLSTLAAILPAQAEDEPLGSNEPETSTPAQLPEDTQLLPDSVSDEDEDPESALAPEVLNGLTSSTARFLSQLLALLAAYVPPGEKSMQNRVRPVNWESILDIAAVGGLVDQETLEAVHRRLSDIYPTFSVGVKHNFRFKDLSPRTRPTDDLSFLELDGYAPESPKNKRGPYRKRGQDDPEDRSRRSSKRLKSAISEE